VALYNFFDSICLQPEFNLCSTSRINRWASWTKTKGTYI